MLLVAEESLDASSMHARAASILRAAHAAGFTMALRISAAGVTLTQHLATISAAQGQVFASTIALSMGEGTTAPALPIAADRLGALTAQRVSEAGR